MKYEFIYNPRIEVASPIFYVPFEEWDDEDISQFHEEAQSITSKIPAKILDFDKRYMSKYDQLEVSPESFFEILEELNEMSGKISELNVLYLQLEGKFLYASSHQ